MAVRADVGPSTKSSIIEQIAGQCLETGPGSQTRVDTLKPVQKLLSRMNKLEPRTASESTVPNEIAASMIYLAVLFAL